MFWWITAIIMQFATAIPTYYDAWWLYDTFNDISFIFVAIAAYKAIHIRKWREKILSLILLIITLFNASRNALIEMNVIQDTMVLSLSLMGILTFTVLMATILLDRWEYLQSDPIREGYMFEIIGKPYDTISLVAYFLTLGRGGYFALTDGIMIFEFNDVTGKWAERPFDERIIKGKNVVEIGQLNPVIWEKYHSLLGKKWSYFFNCVTIIAWRNFGSSKRIVA